MRDGASIQPAQLARGLRRVLLERGVTIHEGTQVSRVIPGSEAAAVTPRGIVRAPQAVIAINAWAMEWPELRRRLVAWSSYIVLTAPAPDRLEAIHWTTGELVSDLRTSVRYFRTTPDGRIAFGGGGGRAGTSTGDVFTRDARAVVQAAEGFRRLFPSFAGVPIVDAWAGPSTSRRRTCRSLEACSRTSITHSDTRATALRPHISLVACWPTWSPALTAMRFGCPWSTRGLVSFRLSRGAPWERP
jgi:glycine/D-amino acid oxidase-like deaminating enzyme